MNGTPVDLDWLISVDDHVVEPVDVWRNRLPRASRDRAPHVILDDGMDWWAYDGKRIPINGLAATAGRTKEDFSPEPVRYDEMRAACYDPTARIRDMDEGGVLASLCFPSFPRFCGQVFLEGSDKALDLQCVRAYNDWMIDEWCGSAPGRFIPLIIVPLWDPVLAADEVRRCAAKGARALAFSENPVRLGLPSIYDPGHWDPLWEACDETGCVVCMHIGSSSFNYSTAPQSPNIVKIALGPPVGIVGAMVDWLFAPPFRQYPGLKIALAEGGIGWIPYMLERLVYTVDQHRHWVGRFSMEHEGTSVRDEDASGVPDLDEFDVLAMFREHVFGCFVYDFHGLRNIDAIGIDNVMFETDYPHSDTTWPRCIEFAHEQLGAAGLAAGDQYKVLRGNAERLFGFTPASPPPRRRGR
jgi:predicted TIM-barrel fold metal-dependent hydrolase